MRGKNKIDISIFLFELALLLGLFGVIYFAMLLLESYQPASLV